jgi:hypothetical protein
MFEQATACWLCHHCKPGKSITSCSGNFCTNRSTFPKKGLPAGTAATAAPSETKKKRSKKNGASASAAVKSTGGKKQHKYGVKEKTEEYTVYGKLPRRNIGPA